TGPTGPARSIASSAAAWSTPSRTCKVGLIEVSSPRRPTRAAAPCCRLNARALRPPLLAAVSRAETTAMSSLLHHGDERAQLDLFRTLPGDLAPRDAQDLMAYPFFSLAKSKRLAPIDFKAGSVKIRVEAVPEHGMATIWDADV